jgi:hypothetical protein
MRKYIIGLGIVGISFCMIIAQAQQVQKPQKKKVTFKGKTYLHGGAIGNGKISKRLFDSLLAYPPVAKDTGNTDRAVTQFTFSYAERGLYEDSTGRQRIMTEYYNTESINGRLPQEWISSIRAKSKAGDTVIIYDVMARYADTGNARFYAEPIKLVLTE